MVSKLIRDEERNDRKVLCLGLSVTSRLTRVGSNPATRLAEAKAKAVCWKAGDPWAYLNYQDPLFQHTGRHPRQTGGSLRGGSYPSNKEISRVFLTPIRLGRGCLPVGHKSVHPLAAMRPVDMQGGVFSKRARVLYPDPLVPSFLSFSPKVIFMLSLEQSS